MYLLEPSPYARVMEDLSTTLHFLSDKPEETPESTLRALWLKAAGTPVSAEKAMQTPLPQLTAQQELFLQQLINQRKQGVPLGHLSGRQSFMGLEFCTDSRALLPRKETELLATKALELLQRLADQYGRLKVLDLCCGSGNVGLSLAAHQATCKVYCGDLSPEAVELCRENIVQLGLSERAEARVSDLGAAWDLPEYQNSFQLLTCNPPYITSSGVDRMDAEIAHKEPRLAFDGGMLGINIMKKLLHEAPRLLVPKGWLVFELGAGQGPFMQQLIDKTGHYHNTQSVCDAAGTIRVLATQKKA